MIRMRTVGGLVQVTGTTMDIAVVATLLRVHGCERKHHHPTRFYELDEKSSEQTLHNNKINAFSFTLSFYV
jgi:hypothetical protein